LRLKDRVCLITGAASGIGQATAKLFAREGALVLVADIDDQGARTTVESIVEAGGAASVHHLDVTSGDSCKQLVDAIIGAYHRIDVLFNNAGIAGIGTVHETALGLWERVLAVNVLGVYQMSKYVLLHMMQQRSGSVINMSSTLAEIGLANRAPYAASKGAVLSLTRCMQVDYAPYGIRVNALLPGTIHTPFVDRYLRESYSDPAVGLETIRKRQITGDLGRPEDVAYAALYLASDESRFVLGSAMFVDGGVRGTK
jgi:NAD(P)-dependent dehydrogenase (short-subunit alcohol dehydrogenase family)